VVIRKPSSPYRKKKKHLREYLLEVEIPGTGAYIFGIGPDRGLRAEMVLQLGGDDLLVNVEVGDPVFVHERW